MYYLTATLGCVFLSVGVMAVRDVPPLPRPVVRFLLLARLFWSVAVLAVAAGFVLLTDAPAV